MRKLLTLTAAAALVAAFGFAAGPASAQSFQRADCSGEGNCIVIKDADLGSDFALFDGASAGSGGLCSVTNSTESALVVAPWRWYVSIANGTDDPHTATVKYFDGDTVSYPIPAHSSFAFSAAAGGGSIDEADKALRLVAGIGLTGSVSVRGPKKDEKVVFCISCDDTSDLALCNAIIP